MSYDWAKKNQKKGLEVIVGSSAKPSAWCSAEAKKTEQLLEVIQKGKR